MDAATSKTSERPTRRIEYISAGASHTVALLSGEIVCSWGRGEDGQLGHGDADERHVPTIVTALTDCEISSITCGADHTTTRSDSRLSVYSWGWGDFGRLGHGNSSDLFIPHPIRGLQGTEIKQIACGDSHCLAVTGDGEVKSWGRNQNGQLGLGNTEDSLVPCTIRAFQGIPVKMVAAGAEHTAAVSEGGKLYGWGWGRYGNLGLGDRSDRSLPAEVVTVPGVKMNLVACGWRHTIAVSDAGTLYTYGWSKYGQLGHGNYDDYLVPHQVAALKGNRIVQISGGWRHSMALDDEGVLYGWGWNKFGQIGVGNNDDQTAPQVVKFPADEKITQVSCGWRHTVTITKKYNVFSWGRGTSGQLGHGESVDRNLPEMIDALSADGAACVEIGSSQSTAITASANWISPSERYAVVPDESVRSLASRLHQTASVSSQVQLPTGGGEEDASVPLTEFKRIRTV